MREIPLSQGRVALVDDVDYEWLMRWKWCASVTHGVWYAIRHTSNADAPGPRQIVLMHREILGTFQAPLVDHRDRNGLNNQRFNLRPANFSQSNHNRGPMKTNKLGVKGVYFCKTTHKFRAEIRVDGKKNFLGVFSTVDEASQVYQSAAALHYGEFASI